MNAPPGLTPITSTEPFGELITGTRQDLSTRNGQLRYLVDELGVNRRQAQALIRAYVLDQKAPLPKSATKTYRRSFLAWLMEERPLGLNPGRKVARPDRDYRPRDTDGRLAS